MIIAILIIFSLFIIWTINMLKDNLNKVDSMVYKSLKIKNIYTKIFICITNMASTKFLCLASLLFLLFLKNKTIAILIIINIIFTSLLIGFLKNIFKRERPNINRLVKERGYSYPSGHTMSATSFYSFLIFLIIISTLTLPLKVILSILIIILILTVGLSRIYLGVHYFTDVVGGLLMSSSYILLYIYIITHIINLI